MAVQSKFEIDFACGHTETRDLSVKPAGKRKGFANWLSLRVLEGRDEGRAHAAAA